MLDCSYDLPRILDVVWGEVQGVLGKICRYHLPEMPDIEGGRRGAQRIIRIQFFVEFLCKPLLDILPCV